MIMVVPLYFMNQRQTAAAAFQTARRTLTNAAMRNLFTSIPAHRCDLFVTEPGLNKSLR